MGGANSVGLPGTHLNSVANTHTDPIVRSNESSSNGKLVVEDANTNARNVSSAPSKIGEGRGHATMVANSVLAFLDRASPLVSLLLLLLLLRLVLDLVIVMNFQKCDLQTLQQFTTTLE